MIHAESRVRVGRPGSDHVSTRRDATIVGRWCGRTLHGRTVVNVSTGDRYMQKVGSGGRDRTLSAHYTCSGLDDDGRSGGRPIYRCVDGRQIHAERQISGARPDFHTCNFLCMRRLWLGWLLMRRRQVETSSDLGRPPDPTFCMYLSPVDTSINWPPARPSVVVKPGTCIMRRQRPISAARPDFLHVSVARRHIDHRPSMQSPPAPPPDYGCFRMYASSTSRNMVRSRPPAQPDFLHVSVARRHIDNPAARPSMQSPPAPPPDYGCFRTYASSTSRNMVRSRPPDPNPTFCMYHG